MQLTPAVLGTMRAAAEATYPEECCGALLGKVNATERLVLAALPLDNTTPTARQRRFVIDAAAYRDAERQAEQRGLVLVGFYHSHPDHPARPSATDLEQALPWHSYVILAVDRGRTTAWTSWILAADRERFEPEPMLVVEAIESNALEGTP